MTLPFVPTGQEKFSFASNTSYWIYFKVSKKLLLETVGQTLDEAGYNIASFEDPEYGYVALCPMFYTGLFGEQCMEKNQDGMIVISEAEFTVLAYPKRDFNRLSPMRFQEYILGHDPEKLIGQYRLSVVCDSLPAVYGGRNKYGEHKFLGDINYKINTFNNNSTKLSPIKLEFDAYQWCGAGKQDQMMFSLSLEIANSNHLLADISPMLVYGAEPAEKHPAKKQRPLAARRTYLASLFEIYFPENENIKVNIKYGNCQNAQAFQELNGSPIEDSIHWPRQMRESMQAMLENSIVSAVTIFQSPPVVTEPRPYYAD